MYKEVAYGFLEIDCTNQPILLQVTEIFSLEMALLFTNIHIFIFECVPFSGQDI